MVAKGKKRRTFANAAEAAKAVLAAVPVTDEDPAVFWGPDWKKELEEAGAERKAAPRRVYYTLDEFFASLEKNRG